MIKNIIKDKRGATTTEYAILIGLLALVVLAAVKVMGVSIKNKLEAQSKTIDGIGSSKLVGRPPSRVAHLWREELQTDPSCGCHGFS